MNPAVKISRKLSAIGCFALFLSVMVLPSPSFGSEKGQIYGSLIFTFSKISGKSFDGHSGSEVSGVYASVPKLDPSPGYGAVIGIRGDFFGVELGYVYSTSKGSLFDPTPAILGSRAATALTHTLNVDFKFHFWTERTIGAYAYGGLSVVLLNAKKNFFGQEDLGLKPGSSTEHNYVWKEYGDAGFFGIGIDLGAGLEVALSQRIVLTGGVILRPTFFSSLDLQPYDASYNTSAYDFSLSGIKGINLGLTVGLQYYIAK